MKFILGFIIGIFAGVITICIANAGKEDEEKYQDLSQEEYEEVIKNYVNYNVEHYEAIVVSVN